MNIIQPKQIIGVSIVLRFVEANDNDEIYDLLSDDDVMKFIGPRKGLDKNQVHSWICQNIREYEDGWNRWAIADKEKNEFIGMVGIKSIGGIYDFGYYIRKKYWGHGIAKSAIVLAMRCLKELDIKYEIFVNEENTRSLYLIRSVLSQRGDLICKNEEIGFAFHV